MSAVHVIEHISNMLVIINLMIGDKNAFFI